MWLSQTILILESIPITTTKKSLLEKKQEKKEKKTFKTNLIITLISM